MNILTYENAVKALYCAQVFQESRVGILFKDSRLLRDKAEYLAKLGHGKIYSAQDYCEIRLWNGSSIILRPLTVTAKGLRFDYVLYDSEIDTGIFNVIIEPIEESSRMETMFTDLMDTFEPKRLFV